MKLILGCASTGARYTPRSHRSTGRSDFDAIMTGRRIVTTIRKLVEEAKALEAAGVRYYHYHARNPATREQTTDTGAYSALGTALRAHTPGLILSFGASRKGVEVLASVEHFGEACRALHALLPCNLGGAEFVTLQAAAELQVIKDAERQGLVKIDHHRSEVEFADHANRFQPSLVVEDLSLSAYSAFGGSNYGSTSSQVQFEFLKNLVQCRRIVGGHHEVEWVQLLRSYAMTRFCIEHDEIDLGETGQLNVTILFGFSPRLPFPSSYEEFKKTVRLAKSLEDIMRLKYGHGTVTVCTGAAVLPTHVAETVGPLDVSRDRGKIVGPLQRLAAYACQPDSEVDILRFGVEDTPFLVDDLLDIHATTNEEIGRSVSGYLERYEVECETAPEVVRERLLTNDRAIGIDGLTPHGVHL